MLRVGVAVGVVGLVGLVRLVVLAAPNRARNPITAGRIPVPTMSGAAVLTASTTSTSSGTSKWKAAGTIIRPRAPRWLALPSPWEPRRVPRRLPQTARPCIPVGSPSNNVSSRSVNNVNVERNVNMDVDHGGQDNDYHPVATAAAVGAAVAVTSAVVGSMVRALPHLRGG